MKAWNLPAVAHVVEPSKVRKRVGQHKPLRWKIDILPDTDGVSDGLLSRGRISADAISDKVRLEDLTDDDLRATERVLGAEAPAACSARPERLAAEES